MPRIAAIDALQDRRAKARKARERKRALKSPKRQARLRVVLKVLACVVLVLLFGAMGFLVGDVNYRATLIGWVPFFMLITGIIVAGIYLLVLKRGISFGDVSNLSDCKRGQEVTFTIRFHNKTLLLATRMRAFLFISDMFGNAAHEVSTTLALGPHEQSELVFDARFEHIGRYTAGLEHIDIADFLGLFTTRLNNPARHVVRVTPKLLELDGIALSNESMDEATKAAKSVIADSMDYAYVREYEPGDPLKKIHWKLSARSRNYMTRLYEMHTNPTVAIVMDFYGQSDEARDLMGMFDAVVESAFSLGNYARRKGMEVEIHYVDKYGRRVSLPAWTEDGLADIIDDFPQMSSDPERAQDAIGIVQDTISSVHGASNIIVCSANVDYEMVSSVLEARIRRRAPLMVAVVPQSLIGRQRDDHCKNLLRFEAASIPYSIISKSDELASWGDAR